MNFINNWQGSDRQSAWSGTPFSILTSLSKQIMVVDAGIHRSGFERAVFRILSRGQQYSKRWTADDYGIWVDEKRIDSESFSKQTPCLMFAEYVTRYIGDSYIYQDLTQDFVARMHRQNDRNKKYAPSFSHHRKKHALEFYEDCKGIFTMSKWLRDDLINCTKIPADKVHFVGGGSNIDVQKVDASKKQGNKFLFVGKDYERKNGPLVVEAFGRLREKYDHVELHIVGPKEKPASVGRGIFFWGQLSFDNLVQHFNLCDFFVMPSNFEAYGLVFAEALIFGLPCIGSNRFAMPEFITDSVNGLLINEQSVDELSAKMETMLLDGERFVNTVKQNRREYIKQYSWDAVADRIIKVMVNDGYRFS